MPPLLPICLLETGAENIPKRRPGLAVDPIVCLNGENARAYLCGSTDARREDGCLRAPAACTGKGRRYAEPSVVTCDIGRAGADKSVSVEGAEADPSLTPAEGSEPASHRLGHAEDGRNHRSELVCASPVDPLDTHRPPALRRLVHAAAELHARAARPIAPLTEDALGLGSRVD